MKTFWLILPLVVSLVVKAQPPASEGLLKPNVQIVLTSDTLGEGTQWSVSLDGTTITVSISASDDLNLKKIIPGILTEIVADEVRRGLNGTQLQDHYYSFYLAFGKSLTFDDLFGYHPDRYSDSFLKRLLAKFDAAAGPIGSADPLYKDLLTIRHLFLKVITEYEMIGLFNGEFLHSFHEKSRQIVSQVLAGKPDAEVLVNALTTIENSVATAQYYVLKFLELLRLLKIFPKPSSQHSNEYIPKPAQNNNQYGHQSSYHG